MISGSRSASGTTFCCHCAYSPKSFRQRMDSRVCHCEPVTESTTVTIRSPSAAKRRRFPLGGSCQRKLTDEGNTAVRIRRNLVVIGLLPAGRLIIAPTTRIGTLCVFTGNQWSMDCFLRRRPKVAPTYSLFTFTYYFKQPLRPKTQNPRAGARGFYYGIRTGPSD